MPILDQPVNILYILFSLWLLKTFPYTTNYLRYWYIDATHQKYVLFHCLFSMLIDIIWSYDTHTKKHLIQLWTEIIKFLDAKHDSKKIVTFLNKCAFIGIDEKEKVLHLGVPNEFVLSQVKKFFKKAINDGIHQTYNNDYSLNLVVYDDLQQGGHELQIDLKKHLTTTIETSSPNLTTNKKEATLKESWLSEYFGILFEKKYNFDNYVIWATNELAASAGKAIAENPGEVYNPFFIYGDVGLGKTHLMQAIGNHIIDNQPEKVIVYLPSTKFIDKIIHAVRFNKLDHFKQKLEEVDVLMIDDIQFLAGKDKTQEIFHNIFNDFYAKGKQIVITSDESPKALTLLEPRLQSRFSLGLVADIKAPDLETRMAILQSKAQKKDIQLEEKHTEIIAEAVDTNVRELEWALNIVITKQQLLKRELTDDDIYNSLDTLWIQDTHRPWVQETIKTQTQVVAAPTIQPSTITNTSVSAYEKKLANIAAYYGLEIKNIKGNSRTKELSFARQCAMYIAKTQFNRSLQKIGNYFGGKNHSSVIYSIRKFEATIKKDAQTKEIVKGF